MPRLASTVVVILLAASSPLSATAAEPGCDCRRRVGLCQAEARFEGAEILFTSQTEQCSRISFTAGGHEGAVTIRRGRGSVGFAAPRADAQARVTACYVCDVEAARD